MLTDWRWTTAIALCGALACGGDGSRSGGWFARGDSRTVTTSAGDAELDANGRLNLEVTSDLYRRWTAAQAAVGRTAAGKRVGQLGRRLLTDEELEQAVAALENDARMRAAIEGAGLTVREYVYATVAIEQAMAVASGKLQPRKDEVAGIPPQNVDMVMSRQAEIPPPVTDTALYPAAPPPPLDPLPPTPLPVPAPTPVQRPRPDTLVPPLDTVRPAPVGQPSPTPNPQPVPSRGPRPASPSPTPRPTPAQPVQPPPPPVDTTVRRA